MSIFSRVLFASIIILLFLGILSAIMNVFEERRQTGEENLQSLEEQKRQAEERLQEQWSITKIEEQGECFITGCSREICSDEKVASPCIWKSEYICYQDAVCARDQEGTCAWQKTPELEECLSYYR